jgi:hypothetical protein
MQPPPVVPVVATVAVTVLAPVAVVAVPVVLEEAPPEASVTLCPQPNTSAIDGTRHQNDFIVPPPNCVKKAMTRS